MTRPILFILPSVEAAGAEIQAMIQIRELSRRGVPVRLMVLSEAIDPKVLAGAGLPEEHICRLRNPSQILYAAFIKKTWRDIGRAAAFVRHNNVRTVVAHLTPSYFFSRLLFLAVALRGRRLRLFQYHHSEEYTLRGTDTRSKRLFFALDGILARICDHAHLHVSDRVMADVMTGAFTRRNAVVHNTCDMDSPGDVPAAELIVEQVRSGGDPWVVLLPGRLIPRKGHQLLLAAFRRLIESESLLPGNIQLLFAGEGTHRREIMRDVSERDLDSFVSLLGAVPHDELLALFGLADLVVIPSHVEGFGIVAIEAMSRGALVIASDAAGLDEIVRPGENGFQFAVGDEDALLRTLTDVWQHRDDCPIDREAVRAEMRTRFGVDAHCDRLRTLLGV